MLRTVKWWVIYDPNAKVLLRQPFRTKKDASKYQPAGSIVFQVKGHYAPGTVKRASRRHGDVHE